MDSHKNYLDLSGPPSSRVGIAALDSTSDEDSNPPTTTTTNSNSLSEYDLFVQKLPECEFHLQGDVADGESVVMEGAGACHEGFKVQEFFCEDCEVPVCIACAADLHEGHSFVTMFSKVKKATLEIANQIDGLKSRLENKEPRTSEEETQLIEELLLPIQLAQEILDRGDPLEILIGRNIFSNKGSLKNICHLSEEPLMQNMGFRLAEEEERKCQPISASCQFQTVSPSAVWKNSQGHVITADPRCHENQRTSSSSSSSSIKPQGNHLNDLAPLFQGINSLKPVCINQSGQGANA